MKFDLFLSQKGKYIDSNFNLNLSTLKWASKSREKAKTFPGFIDATIGTAREDNGTLMTLPTLKEEMSNLSNDQLFDYVNFRGLPQFIEGWQKDTLDSFPKELREQTQQLSTVPVTTCGGLTGGLTVAGQVFFNRNDPLFVPNYRWENVDNLFFYNQGLEEINFNLLDQEGNLNFEDLMEKIKKYEKTKDRIGIYFNFPNNPTGVSPNITQIKELQDFFSELTIPTIILLDDAYEGYSYTDIPNHSLFPYLVGLNENVVVIKVDGVTKRYCAYGARLGLVTVGVGTDLAGNQKENLEELLAKTSRTITSVAPRGIQEALARIFNDPAKLQKIKEEKIRNRKILEKRFSVMKEVIKERNSDVSTPVEFNSGFFGYFIIEKTLSALKLGDQLLEKGLGIVPSEKQRTKINGIRLTYCAISEDNIRAAIEILYNAIS